MPELPEVETVRMALDDALLGGRICAVAQSAKPMRWAIPKNLKPRILGGRIEAVRRRAKYLLLDIGTERGGTERGAANHANHPSTERGAGTERGAAHHAHHANHANHAGELCLLLHLGMSGSVRIYPPSVPKPKRQKHDHLMLTAEIDGGAVSMVLNDPRRFGGVVLMEKGTQDAHPLLCNLGCEPLGNAWNGAVLLAGLASRRGAIKPALLDQNLVAGIGNIYASEALFAAGIAPETRAQKITLAEAERLALAVRDVLTRAIAAGGTSIKNHIQPGGEIGYFAQTLNVYGRAHEACYRCGDSIKMLRQNGRSSFYCPQCQK